MPRRRGVLRHAGGLVTGMDSEKSRDAPDVFRAAGMADGRIADYLCHRAASGRKESDQFDDVWA